MLLDTHVVAWLSFDPKKIPKRASSAIRRTDGLGVSAITLWELAWLKTRDRLQLAGGIAEYLDDVASRISVIPITTRIAMLAAQFSQDYSTDPCDRIIAATALAEGMLLLTKDERMRACRQLQTTW